MNYRRAIPEDYILIEDLQKRNLVSALNDADKNDGFLSGFFNVEELAELNNNLCISVCTENENILGFLCASTTDFNKHFSLPAAMIKCYPDIFYKGKPLSDFTSYIAGPVCIEKTARGKGVFEGLYKELFSLLPQEYNLSVTLVSESNTRSLAAHYKIGYAQVGKFDFENRPFEILATAIIR